MSHLEKITGELRALMTGVERAQGLAAVADRQAQEVALRAAGAGFAAMAAGMPRVRSAVTAIQGGLGSLSGAIGEATKATAAVPHGATPQETISGLTPVQAAVDSVRDATAGVITQVGDAQQLVTMILQGGQPGPLRCLARGACAAMVGSPELTVGQFGVHHSTRFSQDAEVDVPRGPVAVAGRRQHRGTLHRTGEVPCSLPPLAVAGHPIEL